jgi:two-component system response regulator YesN
MYQVMVVDDSEVVLQELRRSKCWRDTPDFVVNYEARNGYEALQKLADTPVDLVITDIRMPKVNGLELLQKIKERELAEAVVILSEYQEFSYARQGMVLGAFDYLVKPVAEADLIRCLTRVAGHLNKTAFRQTRMQQLEEQAVKSSRAEYLEVEIDKFVMEVTARNPQAQTTAADLILFLNKTIDRHQASGIIHQMTNKIVSRLKQAYPWIDNFIPLEPGRLGFFKIHDPERLVEAFTAWIAMIMGKLDRLMVEYGNNILAKEVCGYVLNHIDRKLTIQSVADALFVHRSYLSMIFRQQTGIKLNEYLHIVKLERAQKLLAEGGLLNYQIAGELGFKDVIYFGQIFKKYTGMSPSKYKQL